MLPAIGYGSGVSHDELLREEYPVEAGAVCRACAHSSDLFHALLSGHRAAV